MCRASILRAARVCTKSNMPHGNILKGNMLHRKAVHALLPSALGSQAALNCHRWTARLADHNSKIRVFYGHSTGYSTNIGQEVHMQCLGTATHCDTQRVFFPLVAKSQGCVVTWAPFHITRGFDMAQTQTSTIALGAVPSLLSTPYNYTCAAR